MTIVAFDSFDLYRTPADMGAGRWNVGEWGEFTEGGFYGNLVAGRFGGNAFQVTANLIDEIAFTKIFQNHYTTLSAGVSVYPKNPSSPAFIRFEDTNSQFIAFQGWGSQCAVIINPDGSVAMATAFGGGIFGLGYTIIATSATGLVPQNTWSYIEARVAFSTNGAFDIHVNGVSVVSGTGNLQSRAEGYADGISLGMISDGFFATDQCVFDDLYVACEHPFLGSWKAEVKYPTGDTAQKDFTPYSHTLGIEIPITVSIWSGTTLPHPALALSQYQSRSTGTVTSARVYWHLIDFIPDPTGGGQAVKTKCVLYSDNNGEPGDCIAVSTEQPIIPGSIAYLDYTFTPIAIMRGKLYWIGWISDAAVNFPTTDQNTFGYTLNVYPSTPSNPILTAVIGGAPSVSFFTTTTSNFPCVDDTVVDRDASYVETTVGGEDLYLMPQWTYVPKRIEAVQVVSMARKTTQGSVWYRNHIETEWNEAYGEPNAPGTDWRYFTDLYNADPNTGAAWTGKAVNAIRGGFVAYEGLPPPVTQQRENIIPQPLVLPR